MPGRTYLWMFAIYGLGGLGLGAIRDVIPSTSTVNVPFILTATMFIYAMEFSSGWFLRKITGRCPWDYGDAKFGIAGLVRLDYFPFWIGVAAMFDVIVRWIDVGVKTAWRIMQ